MEMTVTKKAMRPASDKEQCFYCQQPIGGSHKDDCVLVQKKVRVQLTIEYEVAVPHFWDKHAIEFHRNEGSWCSSNLINELQELDERVGCLCGEAIFVCFNDEGAPELEEE